MAKLPVSVFIGLPNASADSVFADLYLVLACFAVVFSNIGWWQGLSLFASHRFLKASPLIQPVGDF